MNCKADEKLFILFRQAESLPGSLQILRAVTLGGSLLYWFNSYCFLLHKKPPLLIQMCLRNIRRPYTKSIRIHTRMMAKEDILLFYTKVLWASYSSVFLQILCNCLILRCFCHILATKFAANLKIYGALWSNTEDYDFWLFIVGRWAHHPTVLYIVV